MIGLIIGELCTEIAIDVTVNILDLSDLTRKALPKQLSLTSKILNLEYGNMSKDFSFVEQPITERAELRSSSVQLVLVAI